MTADYMPRWQNRITMNGMAFIELTPVKGLTIRSSLGVKMPMQNCKPSEMDVKNS